MAMTVFANTEKVRKYFTESAGFNGNSTEISAYG